MLTANSVSLQYGKSSGLGLPALQEFSLTVNRGDEVGIYGPSGSGKSSLLYVLSGLKDPTSGEVVFDGVKLNELSERDRAVLRRRHFGFVFQEHFLIEHLTVRENILVPWQGKEQGKEADAGRQVAGLLEFLGLTGLEERFPFELSGGQKQRVAIARALINKPAVVFADEPTAALDEKNARDVLRLLRAYRKEYGVTLLVVSHDLALIQGMSRKIKVTRGQVVEVQGDA